MWIAALTIHALISPTWAVFPRVSPIYRCIVAAGNPRGLVLSATFFRARVAIPHPTACMSVQALEVNSDLRVKLGSANNAEATCDVAEEVLAREAEEEARSPVEMRARCDVSDAPFATWYRRHRFVGNGMVRDGDGPALEATQFEP